ncbi:hypothetical protein ACH4CE_25540 [Streptomyces gelaticus]
MRRNVLALGTAGLTVFAVLKAQWLLGIGIGALITAMVIDLVYRP